MYKRIHAALNEYETWKYAGVYCLPMKLLLPIDGNCCDFRFYIICININYDCEIIFDFFSLVFSLQQIEFEWVLHVEVHSVLKNLHTLLVVSARPCVSVVSLIKLIQMLFVRSDFRSVPIDFRCHCTATMDGNRINSYWQCRRIIWNVL